MLSNIFEGEFAFSHTAAVKRILSSFNELEMSMT